MADRKDTQPEREPAVVAGGTGDSGGAGGLAVGVGPAAVVYFGLALLYFLPAFLPGRHIFGTDYLAAGYFFQEFISERLAAGALPKWVPYLYGGLPLFSNPGSTFYPFRFLADLLFPASRIIPTIFAIQFGIAGLGAYLLARELEVRRWIALLTGLAFQFTGLMMSYVYAGHDGRVIVATFTPLAFFFLHRGIRTGRLGPFVGAAGTIGFALLSFQIQSAYYLLLAGGIWALFCLVRQRVYRDPGALAARVAMGMAAVGFGFALAAVNFLPFLDYVDASPRGGEEGRGYDYSVSWSMPPAEITGLAVPELVGVSVGDPGTGEPEFPSYEGRNPFKLHTEYVGAFVLLLLALGPVYARRNRYWWFFLALGAFALTIAFGGHTPLYRLYYELLPGTKRFRAPSISFFLVSTSLVMMAGLTLEALARRVGAAAGEIGGGGGTGRGREETGAGAETVSAALWITAGVAALSVLAAIVVSGGAGADPRAGGVVRGLGRFALFTVLTAGALWAWLRGWLTPRVAALGLAVLVVADLWVVDRRFFHTTAPPATAFRSDDVADFLRTRERRDRVWVLPFPAGRTYRAGTPDYLMRFDIDQAGGEHGNQLQRYNELLGAGERTYVDWHNFISGNTTFMNVANVRWIVSMARLDGVPELPDLQLVHGGPGALIYENPAALPRAYLVGDVIEATAPGEALDVLGSADFDPYTSAVVSEPLPRPLAGIALSGEAEIVDYGPDRVDIRARTDGRALLVLADNLYDGWRVTVDGEPRPIIRTNHTFRGVVLEPGDHRVVFEFRPSALYAGLWIYLAGLALLAGYGAFVLVQLRRAGRQPAESGPEAP